MSRDSRAAGRGHRRSCRFEVSRLHRQKKSAAPGRGRRSLLETFNPPGVLTFQRSSFLTFLPSYFLTFLLPAFRPSLPAILQSCNSAIFDPPTILPVDLEAEPDEPGLHDRCDLLPPRRTAGVVDSCRRVRVEQVEDVHERRNARVPVTE